MELQDYFINIPLNSDTLDRYSVRNSIFNALSENLSNFKGPLLDVGCGKMPYEQFILNNSKVTQYVGLDLDTHNVSKYQASRKADIVWDGFNMPIEDSSFSTVMATEVLEHCPYPQIVLNEIFRVLKPEGFFFFTVPFLWPLHEVPYDEYRYTPFSLQRMLKETGFSQYEIKSLGGWNASLAQMLGLWVKRAPMSERKRKYLIPVVKPIVTFLLKKDKINNSFKKEEMITGLYGVATK